MKIQTTAAFGVGRARRATFQGWLYLSLVASLLVLLSVAAAAPAAAADAAEKQLQFGANMARRGLWKEALFRFQQAARHDPENPRILNNIAVSYEALGLFDEALDAYRKALRAGPADRELKGNYARFAEFYQSFRPAEEDDESDESESAAAPAEETGE